MKQIHNIQLNILKKLLFAEKLKYSQIKPEDLENSQFKFHMDKLISDGLVIKEENIGYKLTQEGKEFSNRIKTENTTIIKQAKLSTVICSRRILEKEYEYLLYTRLKNPFFGCQGFPTEKVEFGESILDAVKRGLKEETNLVSEPKLIGIRHYLVLSEKQNKLLEDKVMYIFLFEDPKGNLKGNEEGEYIWVKESEISKYIKKPLEEFNEILEMIKTYNNHITFKEVIHKTNKF